MVTFVLVKIAKFSEAQSNPFTLEAIQVCRQDSYGASPPNYI